MYRNQFWKLPYALWRMKRRGTYTIYEVIQWCVREVPDPHWVFWSQEQSGTYPHNLNDDNNDDDGDDEDIKSTVTNRRSVFIYQYLTCIITKEKRINAVGSSLHRIILYYTHKRQDGDINIVVIKSQAYLSWKIFTDVSHFRNVKIKLGIYKYTYYELRFNFTIFVAVI